MRLRQIADDGDRRRRRWGLNKILRNGYTIRLRFVCDSPAVRLPFDCNSSALRPFDERRYDRRPTCTCCGLLYCDLNK